MKQAIIAPSVLASDFAKLADESQRMVAAGADWLHLDVMDGHFVPNISFGAPVVGSLRKHIAPGAAGHFFDCHLMVAHPEKWVADFKKAGADQFTFHIEAVESVEKAKSLVQTIHDAGMKVGVSVKPKTPVESVFPLIDTGLVHTLLVMTVEPGFGGQSFMADMMPKLVAARERYPDLIIQVDGGITEATAPIAAKNGANALVAGTALFVSPDAKASIQKMREAIEGI